MKIDIDQVTILEALQLWADKTFTSPRVVSDCVARTDYKDGQSVVVYSVTVSDLPTYSDKDLAK